MSRIRADRYTNRAGTGAPTFSDGVNVVGITSVNPGTGSTSMLVTGDLSVISGTIKGASELSISGITSSITDTAIDIFVYDTRKDSDGGAWRKRTQNTSWYNETLNTATRGSRKEFPAVAVIVATASNVTIYDGDDPDLPMWMVFTKGTGAEVHWLAADNSASVASATISALNGTITSGVPGGAGRLTWANFISDEGYNMVHVGKYKFHGGVANRNDNLGWNQITSTIAIVNRQVNDVAMTVLPNAPIDDATGLPVPTIAVATDGGPSVIKDDGFVVSYTRGGNEYTGTVAFDENNDLIISWGTTAGGYRHATRITNPFVGTTTLDTTYGYIASDTGLGGSAAGNTNGVVTVANSGKHFGIDFDSSSGVPANQGNHDDRVDFLHINDVDTTKSLVAFATTSYNTGWMHGNIKLATLSDTDATNVTGTELITNGTFDTDTTGWGAANGATLTQQNNGNPGGNINVASGPTSNGYASQSNTVVVGKYYTLRFDHYHVDGSAGYVNIGTSTGSGNYVYYQLGTASSWTTFQFTVKATSTNMFTGFYSRPNGNVRYDNISLREAVPDLSINNNGLQVFGTVTKSAVATGADLVAYSGFSASNYLQQPYTSDLDFGTGDLSISFWYKTPSGSVPTECFLHRGDGGAGTWGTGKIIQIEFNGSNLAAFLADSAFSSSENVNIPGATAATGQWMHYTLVRRGTFVGAYLNGEFIASTTPLSSRDLTNTSAKTWIGERPNSSRPATTSALALLRMSASAPSVEQIKKMYDDEKVLFQENSQATLYGSSNLPTALTYDDTTELLHVGTSSGRSDFQGLRRINNTTTAVTTALSASNELVAEQ